MFFGRRDRSVGIEMGYGLEDRGSSPVRGKKFFSSPQFPHRLLAHRASSPMSAGGAFSPGIKRTGSEA
jgi:hypothetical protein